jgi:hypothetical protein
MTIIPFPGAPKKDPAPSAGRSGPRLLRKSETRQRRVSIDRLFPKPFRPTRDPSIFLFPMLNLLVAGTIICLVAAANVVMVTLISNAAPSESETPSAALIAVDPGEVPALK